MEDQGGERQTPGSVNRSRHRQTKPEVKEVMDFWRKDVVKIRKDMLLVI